MKWLNWILGAGVVVFGVSCTPMGALPAMNPNGSSGASAAGSASQVSPLNTREQAQVRAQREALGGGVTAGGFPEPVVRSGNEVRIPTSAGGQQQPLDLPSLETNYRYGMPVPGRTGWVYNPYTNRPVDARGVESGRLIYDETDPANRNADGSLKAVSEMPHKFRVP
ncbi:MAG: hypothetical protein AAGC74_03270 [Verrucomicrobiota bacterium]